MGRVDGKVALISGGGGGIGGQAALLLADVRIDEAGALADKIGDRAQAFPLDVTSAASWDDAVAATERAFGPVNVLVNSAGVASYGPTDQVSEDEFRRILDINLDRLRYLDDIMPPNVTTPFCTFTLIALNALP